jgi:superfamily II DNA helicase RecQ
MSDEFDWCSDDEADLVAVTNSTNGKHSLDDDAAVASKRAKLGDEPSLNTILANAVLKERFGLDGFRLEQEAAITRVLDGESAVVVFPTGGGKSLCYQVKDSPARLDYRLM